jgi:hypothetical protein
VPVVVCNPSRGSKGEYLPSFLGSSLGCDPARNLLPNPLVRLGSVEVVDVLVDQAMQMSFSDE